MITLRYPEVSDAERYYEILSKGNFPFYHATIPASVEAERSWLARRPV